MNWQDIIQIAKGTDIYLKLNEPVTSEKLKISQVKLINILPKELREFYQISDGLSEYMEEVGDIGELIWNIDRLVRENEFYRDSEIFQEIYRPFNKILFFGDAGNGDNFGYLKNDEGKENIIRWNHENDERLIIKKTLKEFVLLWTTGKISV